MERAEITHEYRDIILAADKGNLPEIDVLERVMGRITELGDRRRPFLQGAMRSTTALGSVLALILMVSLTAYAASEYIQIRNKAGTVKVQFVAPSEKDASLATYYNKYAKQAQAFAKPGELIAYYVKDKKGSGSSEATLQFEYKQNPINSYSDFSKEIKRTGAPELPKVANGYTFEYGSVSPKLPTTNADKRGSFYQKTLSELTARASNASNGEKMFMMAIPWSEPGFVIGTYSQGRAHIGISINLMHGGKMYVEQEQENKVDKITIAGTEVVYNRVIKENVSYEYLNWYNEEQDAYYTLTSYGGKKLTKEQFLQVASELLE